MELRRSVLVAHPAERLYQVIEAAEQYPAFLPWCASATILHRDDSLVVARIEIAWRGVRFGFVTRNPKRPPHWMAIGLEQGPFRRFEGTWSLTPLAEWGCRVEFWLAYEFNASLLGPLAAPVFDHAANTLVDAFVRRADHLALQPPVAPLASTAPAPHDSSAAPAEHPGTGTKDPAGSTPHTPVNTPAPRPPEG